MASPALACNLIVIDAYTHAIANLKINKQLCEVGCLLPTLPTEPSP